MGGARGHVLSTLASANVRRKQVASASTSGRGRANEKGKGR
jgi:hypothetical protein